MTTLSVVEETAAFPMVEQTLAPYERVEAWQPGVVLFREGDTPTGVFFLHSGEVDLCFTAPRRNEIRPLLTAGPGQLLGLTCIMSGRKHDCTATSRTSCVTGFIPRERFLRLLDERPDLWLNVLQMISSGIGQCWECMRGIAAGR